jgi:penicillin-binding protein 2
MTLPTALAKSCDTYFYQVGYRFYGMPSDRGPRLQAWASRFGFGQKTGIDLGSERSGLLPTPDWRKKTYTKKTDPGHWAIDSLWKPGDSIQLAIGQKDLLVTPMQMARFYAMIANGGKLVTPHIADDVELPGAKGQPPQVLRRFGGESPQPTGIDPTALTYVQRGLEEATHSPNGTSFGVFGQFAVDIAGKTGSAEKLITLPGYPTPQNLTQSWWCGYGPYAAPTIVVCAVIENGGHGGTAAAPAAAQVLAAYFHVKVKQATSTHSD